MGGVHWLSTQVGQMTMLLRIENYFQAHDLLSKTITEISMKCELEDPFLSAQRCLFKDVIVMWIYHFVD